MEDEVQDESSETGNGFDKVKTGIKDTVNNAMESATVKKAKEKWEEVANSEYAKSAKDKFAQTLKNENVAKARLKITEELGRAKLWITENWGNGNYGKFRVIVAGLIVALAVRGLFCGWGGAAVKETTPSKEGSMSVATDTPTKSYQPETHTYACKWCGNQIRSASWPTGFRCPQRPQRPAGRARLPNLPCEWKCLDW